MNWLDELKHIVKHILFHMKQECGVCYNRIAEDEGLVGCYHCKTMMCVSCAQHLFETTAYWCPYCCNRVIYPELCKPSGEYNTELDHYIKLLMKHAIPDDLVQPIAHVAALRPCTIDKLCDLGVSRNSNFDEHFVERMAMNTKVSKIPIL